MKKKKIDEAFEGMSGIVGMKPIHDYNGSSLTKIVKTITETIPAYPNEIKAIDKAYHEYWDRVKDLADALHDKGHKKEAKEFHKTYMKLVSKFHSYFVKFIRKLQ